MTAEAARGALLGLMAASGLLLVLLAASGAPRPRSRRVGPIGRLVESADLPRLSTAGVVGAGLASSGIVATATLIATALPAAALLAGLVAGSVPIVLLRRRVRQRQRDLRGSWPDAVDTLVSGVRAGLSLPEAVADLSRHGPEPLRPAFADFASDYRASGSFAAALGRLQDRLADPVADRVVASLRIAREVGGSDLGVVLRTLSSLLREDARTRGEIEARQSWTVSAARLAVAAPWITLVLLCTRPEAVSAYRSTAGVLVLVGAAVLSITAYRVMMRIGRLPVESRTVS